jgi:hypothetical protein
MKRRNGSELVSTELTAEEEVKQRYKILTNFVNAYKDKMFLSNSTGGADGNA